MFIRVDEQSEHDNYKLLIGSVVPRPIAFVTTVDGEGTVNAAPFSFFNIVSNEPPMVMISCIHRAGGVLKDTPRNILENGEFTVHIADEDAIAAINRTSIDTPAGVSELELAGLTPVPGAMIRVPHVQECKIAMECRLARHLDLGHSTLLIGEVLCFHIADELLSHGRIDPLKLKPVSRLAGASYAGIGEIFELERPKYEP